MQGVDSEILKPHLLLSSLQHSIMFEAQTHGIVWPGHHRGAADPPEPPVPAGPTSQNRPGKYGDGPDDPFSFTRLFPRWPAIHATSTDLPIFPVVMWKSA